MGVPALAAFARAIKVPEEPAGFENRSHLFPGFCVADFVVFQLAFKILGDALLHDLNQRYLNILVKLPDLFLLLRSLLIVLGQNPLKFNFQVFDFLNFFKVLSLKFRACNLIDELLYAQEITAIHLHVLHFFRVVLEAVDAH